MPISKVVASINHGLKVSGKFKSVVLVKSAVIMRNIDESMNPWFSGLAFFIHPTM